MPAAAAVITSAGVAFATSATLPATHDSTGFAALTFIPIGEVVDGGSAGKNYNKVDHSPLSEREVLSIKGSYTQGTRTLELGKILIDAGQIALATGLDSDLPYAFSLTMQNGDVYYFIATVDSFTLNIGTIDSIVGSTVALAQRKETIEVPLP